MIIGDDFEFNLRINKRGGYRLFFNPEIRSYYFARSSWRGGFIKQSFNYGGAVKSVALRKGYFSWTWLFPLAFLGFEVSLSLFSFFRWLFALYWVAWQVRECDYGEKRGTRTRLGWLPSCSFSITL